MKKTLLALLLSVILFAPAVPTYAAGVTVQSTQSAGPVASGSVTITKPVSLAVGDAMVAFINSHDGGAFTTPTGWTKFIDTGTNGTVRQAGFYKIANSSDVAATNFTFSTAGSITSGSITRITGTAATVVDQSNGARNDGTANFSTGGITPLSANSVFLIAVSWRDSSVTSPGSVSGYAIGTSNPTWNETADYNSANVSGQSAGGSLAWGSRPQTTASGNASANISKSITTGVIQVVDIVPPSGSFAPWQFSAF